MPQSEIRNQKSEIENVRCPFCESPNVEMIALFGQQMMTSQYYCHNCHSAFEAVKWEDAEKDSPNDKK